MFPLGRFPPMTDDAVNFGAIDPCIMTWRALQIVPFRGKILDTHAYSPLPLLENRHGATDGVSMEANQFGFPIIGPRSKNVGGVAIHIARGVTARGGRP
jgi:hypothetical protein